MKKYFLFSSGRHLYLSDGFFDISFRICLFLLNCVTFHIIVHILMTRSIIF